MGETEKCPNIKVFTSAPKVPPEVIFDAPKFPQKVVL